jgi:hypothetical protein
MKVRDYVAVEPLHKEPPGAFVDRAGKEAVLADALRGVEMGSYDERIVRWLAGYADDSTLRTIVSLIERVREAGPAGGGSR